MCFSLFAFGEEFWGSIYCRNCGKTNDLQIIYKVVLVFEVFTLAEKILHF
jgi:hypothetical protein